jgi:hypothetical protein
MGTVGTFIYFAVIAVTIYSLWKVFVKAGKPGWAAIVPIYNIIVLLEIVGKPLWWVVLFLIPVVSLVASIIVFIDLAKAFGKGAGFGVGLAFLPFIFFPILGLGEAKFLGALPTAPPQAPGVSPIQQ